MFLLRFFDINLIMKIEFILYINTIDKFVNTLIFSFYKKIVYVFSIFLGIYYEKIFGELHFYFIFSIDELKSLFN